MSASHRHVMMLAGGLLAMVVGATVVTVRETVRAGIEADLDDSLRVRAFALSRIVDARSPRLLPFVEQGLGSAPSGLMLQLFDSEGAPLGRSSNLTADLPLSEVARRSAPARSEAVVEDAVDAAGAPLRLATFARTDFVGADRSVAFFAQVGMPTTGCYEPLRRLTFVLVASGVAVWVLGFGAVRLAVNHSRKAAASLARQVDGLEPADLLARALPTAADDSEWAGLAESLNRLLGRVAAAHGAQQRFVAEASHELRTPLTILLGENDVALRRERSAAEYRETLVSNREEIARLTKVVENLLALARADAGEEEPPSEIVNLHTLCGEVCDQLGPLAEEKRVTLTLAPSPEPPVECPADAIRLQRAVFNLVENALAATPAGENVWVEVSADAAECHIVVSDHGVGIAREHLPLLFDRFYRTAASRARNPDGAGLGLAIVKATADAHRGRIGVTSTVGQGSTFTLSLPAGAD
jgi:signal transduction histidine kinase